MKTQELFRITGLPVFQNKMYNNQLSAITSPVGDVVLVQDLDTGLIFNAAFDANLLTYDQDYQNEQAHSVVFQKHLQDIKSILAKHFLNKSVIEVGCGKGYFLEYLAKEGYDITGVDPAYEGNNPRVIKACFEPSLGLSSENIVLRHVLEHMSDPYSFLQAIANANGNTGKIYIEVPCLDWICEHRAWFDIFYEHVNYFRLSDFHRMFQTVYESGHVFGGQYLYVVADLASLRKPVCSEADIFTFPDDFLSGVEKIPAKIAGTKNAIWGGASKGVIFALYMQRRGFDIDYLIDINPAKQGKYIGVSGLKVSSPEDAIKQLKKDDDIFVMNSNYLQEIIELSGNQFNYIKVD